MGQDTLVNKLAVLSATSADCKKCDEAVKKLPAEAKRKYRPTHCHCGEVKVTEGLLKELRHYKPRHRYAADLKKKNDVKDAEEDSAG